MTLTPRQALQCFALSLSFGFMISLGAQPAMAQESASPDRNVPAAAETASIAASEPAAAEPKPVNISYTLWNDAINYEPETKTAEVGPLAAGKLLASSRPKALPPAPLPRASTAPLTPGEKFQLYVKRTFTPPGPYVQSFFTSNINEWASKDDDPNFKSDHWGDVMTRTARSFAFKITSGFFERFAYASLFRQDPRYHRSGKKGAGARIGYAISRLFITQGDRSGDQFNISYLGGGITAAALQNVWEREERQTVGKTLGRWGNHMMFSAFSNILREFLGGQ